MALLEKSIEAREHLFQLHMSQEDVKALLKEISKGEESSSTLAIRCNNIIEEIDRHLKTYHFLKPAKNF